MLESNHHQPVLVHGKLEEPTQTQEEHVNFTLKVLYSLV